MGSPQKNISQLLEGPYAKHMPQYPSQSEEFVPNDFGGNPWGPSSTPSKQQHHGNNHYANSNNWRRGNNRYFNANRGGNNRGGGGYRNNNQNNFQTNYSYQQNRHSNSGNRQQPYYGQKTNTDHQYEYYHPSMLVDPWTELLDRHNAIKNSEIQAPPTTTEEVQDAITTAIPSTKSGTSANISE